MRNLHQAEAATMFPSIQSQCKVHMNGRANCVRGQEVLRITLGESLSCFIFAQMVNYPLGTTTIQCVLGQLHGQGEPQDQATVAESLTAPFLCSAQQKLNVESLDHILLCLLTGQKANQRIFILLLAKITSVLILVLQHLKILYW